MNSRGVDEHDLPGFASFLLGDVDDAEDTVARRLWLRRNDGQFLADQRIQQRALSSIGTAENANESGVEGHRIRLLASGKPPLGALDGYLSQLRVATPPFSTMFTIWYPYPRPPWSNEIMGLAGIFC